MKSIEIRNAFIDFFKDKGHTYVKSDNLVPQKDPSLLFTTAGMVQFKPLWIGAPLPYTTAVSVQKSLRAGGKGSDLENVGKTLRHHTFFEMLGNFSFGDYFKNGAILYAWEFITEVLNIDKEKLWVSVYKDDDEAFEIWTKEIGFPAERIVCLGDKDNFWGPAGPTGACGPCTEIHIDLGEARGCGKSDCTVGCDCERYLEFWNLVFPQFDQQEDGARPELKRKGIDTGMGLERLCFIMQDAQSNYETDLFLPIIKEIEKITGKKYKKDDTHCFHVIADHIRALTFTFSENILPSNEGRGYVLRRILRRGYRFGTKLGMDEAFMYKLVPVVVDIMKEAYPELVQQREHVTNLVKIEEENFKDTLMASENLLNEVLDKAEKTKTITGQDAFILYDTYGLPIDMIQDIAEEKGISVDIESFNNLMEEQKQRSRDSWGAGKGTDLFELYNKLLSEIGPTNFVGYSSLSIQSKVLYIIKDGKEVEKAIKGDTVSLVLDTTSCYGESGGQVGDKGIISSDGFSAQIIDTVKVIPEIISHESKITEGSIKKGDSVNINVEQSKRKKIAANHTATHILQNVLRQVFGESIKQAGSYVGEDRLRFDFTHFSGINKKELDQIEQLVNEKIFANQPVSCEEKSMKEASQDGVIALFGEKYGDEVRVVSVGEYSKELCGGTHVVMTGDIGLFKITDESSIASGTRRIEAVTGMAAYNLSKEKEDNLKEITQIVKISEKQVVQKIGNIISELKEKEKIIKHLKKKDGLEKLDDIIKDAKDIKGVKILAKKVDVDDINILKSLVDNLCKNNESMVVVLGADTGGKAVFVSGISKDLLAKGYHAGNIVKEVAKQAGGSGGGRPDFAEAGSKDASLIEEALTIVEDLVRSDNPEKKDKIR